MAEESPLARIALVTAGDGGLGVAISSRLAADGFDVRIGTRQIDRGRKAADALVRRGYRASAIELVVDDEQSIATGLGELDRIDVVVNAAGTHSYRALDELTPVDLDFVLRPAVLGTLLVCQQALRRMPNGGRIVNIGSNSMYGGRNVAHYAAAKAALVGLTRALATEVGAREITVNCVAPSLLDTPMTRRSLEDEVLETIAAGTPRRRLVSVGEVASLVAFLASRDAGAITGQCIVVDGGATLPNR